MAMQLHTHGSRDPVADGFMLAAQCYASALPSCGVCPFLRLSITFVDYVETNKHIVKMFSPSSNKPF